MKARLLILLVAAAVLTAPHALAHHSFAATYFEDQTIQIEGRLVQFLFLNPHSFVHVEAPDENGELQRWAVEWGGAGQLGSQGGHRRDTAARRRRDNRRQPRPERGRPSRSDAVVAAPVRQFRLGPEPGRGFRLVSCLCYPVASFGERRLIPKLYSVFVLALAAVSPLSAQMSIVGEWTGRYHEDQGDRVPGDVNGDFTGVPLNDSARRYAESWDVRRVNVLGTPVPALQPSPHLPRSSAVPDLGGKTSSNPGIDCI